MEGFTAHQASRFTGCTPRQLRYWDQIGLVRPSVQQTGGRPALTEGGSVVKTAEETVTDLNYSRHTADYSQSDPLRYEKRMLADWFKARFVNHKADAG